MSFERIEDGAGSSHHRDVHYLGITERPHATPVTRSAKALQQLKFNDETPPPVHHGSPT